MLKLGLTGNIASGKSEAEKILTKKGYRVIDLDIVSHEILKNNKEIFEHFKTSDRKKIGEIVFNNPEEKKVLEKIIHPVLYDFISEEFKKDYDKIVISGALLYEAGFDKLFDKIIFIDAPYDLRLKRLMKRNGFDEINAKKRLNSQNNNYKKQADIVIENSSTLKDLEAAINSIL